MVHVVGPSPLSPRDKQFRAPTEAVIGTPFALRAPRISSETRRVEQPHFDPNCHRPNYNEAEYANGAQCSGLHGFARGSVQLKSWGTGPRDPAPIPVHLGGAHQGPLNDLLHASREMRAPEPFVPESGSELLAQLNRHHVVRTGGRGYANPTVMNSSLPSGLISAHAYRYQPGPRVTGSYDWEQYGSAALRATSNVASTHMPVPKGFWRDEQQWTQGADMVGAAAREQEFSQLRMLQRDVPRMAGGRPSTSAAVYSKVLPQEQFQPC